MKEFKEGQVMEDVEDIQAAISAGWSFKGIVTMEHWRKGVMLHKEIGENTFTTEGMAKLLNIIFHDISKAAAHIWYVGIFKNNIPPALADTAAKLGSGNAYGECQDADYDDPLTNRPEVLQRARIAMSQNPHLSTWAWSFAISATCMMIISPAEADRMNISHN